MARQRSLKTFNIGDITGQGASEATAKANALALAGTALSGSFDPILIPFRGTLGFAWREPLGWVSSIGEVDQEVGTQHKVGTRGSTFYGPDLSRFDVELRIRFHLAQLGWDHIETTSPLLEPGNPGLLAEDEPGRAAWAAHVAKFASVQGEFTSWSTWQLRYYRIKWALEKGGATKDTAEKLARDLAGGMRPDGVLAELQQYGTSLEALEALAGAA